MIRIKPNLPQQDPDGEIENSGKIIFEIRIPNFCYIQILVFYLKLKLSTSGRLPLAAVWTQQVRYHWQIAKVKNYNLNVTEIQDSDFKNAFPGIFNFTVRILLLMYDQGCSGESYHPEIDGLWRVISRKSGVNYNVSSDQTRIVENTII